MFALKSLKYHLITDKKLSLYIEQERVDPDSIKHLGIENPDFQDVSGSYREMVPSLDEGRKGWRYYKFNCSVRDAFMDSRVRVDAIFWSHDQQGGGFAFLAISPASP